MRNLLILSHLYPDIHRLRDFIALQLSDLSFHKSLFSTNAETRSKISQYYITMEHLRDVLSKDSVNSYLWKSNAKLLQDPECASAKSLVGLFDNYFHHLISSERLPKKCQFLIDLFQVITHFLAKTNAQISLQMNHHGDEVSVIGKTIGAKDPVTNVMFTIQKIQMEDIEDSFVYRGSTVLYASPTFHASATFHVTLQPYSNMSTKFVVVYFFSSQVDNTSVIELQDILQVK